MITFLYVNGQQWSFANSISDAGNNTSTSVTVDNDGNILVCGLFSDTLFMPTGPVLPGGLKDAYFMKFDSMGNILWHIILNGTTQDEIQDVVTDENNNIYLAATISDTVVIDAVQIIVSGNSSTLIKLAPSGSLLWYVSGVGNSYSRNITLDKLGNVYLAGENNDDVTFGALTVTNGAGIYNTFILKCNRQSGQVLDLNMISGSGDYVTYCMLSDSSGDIYLTGYDRPVQDPYGKLFMRRISFNGNTSWQYDMESPGGDCYGYGIALDPFGKVYFTGYIYNNVTFNSQQFGQYGKYKNAVLVKYDTTGTLEWARHYGGTGSEVGNSIACDDSGQVYWTGSFEDSLTIGTSVFYASNNLNTDVFLVKMDSSGSVLWNKNPQGYFDEFPVELALNKSVNTLAITGTLAVTMTFDSLTVSNVHGLDAFVARLYLPGSGSVGVKTIIDNDYVTIYTSDNYLIIDNPNKEQFNYSVTNFNGQLVLNGKLNTGLNKIEKGKFSAGIYTVSVTNDNHSVSKLVFFK
jgi:hypothetical protein